MSIPLEVFMQKIAIINHIIQRSPIKEKDSIQSKAVTLYQKLKNTSNHYTEKYIGYKEIESLSIECGIKKNELPSIIILLSNPILNILILKYLYTDKNNQQFEVSLADIQKANQLHYLKHPLTQDRLENTKKTPMYFLRCNQKNKIKEKIT